MSVFLKQGDQITIVEEVAVSKKVTEAVTYTVRISREVTASLEELYRSQRRSSEGFLQFIIRSDIGRVVAPKLTYVYNSSKDTLSGESE